MRLEKQVSTALRTRGRLIGLVALLTFAPLLSLAELGPQLQRALTWLSAQVQSVAVSGEASAVASPIQVRSEVVHTLQLLSRLPGPLADAVYAQELDAGQADTETVARRVLAGAATGADLSVLIDNLRGRQNLDGGFGGGRGYRSSALDTAWAVLAFAQASQSAGPEAVAGRQYLAAQLGTDGSVQPAVGGVRTNIAHRLFSSALSSLALQTHGDSAAAVRRLTQFLSAQQGADGGWAGDVVITAWVLQALSAQVSDAGLRSAASTFLLTRQAGDGSWNADPYVTAVALRALTAGAPSASAGLSSITGAVIDASSGMPVEGASISVSQGGNGVSSASVSDAQGHFTLQGLAAASFNLAVGRAGYQPFSSAITLSTNQAFNIGSVRLLPLATSGIVRGAVSTTEGIPIGGAALQLTSSLGTRTALTDSTGRYEFTAVPPGALSLSASFTGYQTASAAASLMAGQTVLFSPALLRPGESVAPTGLFLGRLVKASDGAGIAAATVTFTNVATSMTQLLTTGTDGRFSTQLAPATYSVRYSAAGFTSAQQTFVLVAGSNFDAGAVPLNTVRSTSDVRGKVRDDAGHAIAGATVAVIGSSQTLSTVSAVDGSYWLAGAGTTNVSLRASATGYDSQSVVLQSDSPTEFQQDFVLMPQAGGALRVDSLAQTSAAVPGNTALTGGATIRNTGATTAKVTGGFLIVNAQDQVVAEGGLLSASGQPLSDITLNAAGVLQITFQWNTAQFVPGAYQLVLRLLEPGTRTRENPMGNLVVERGVAFSISAAQSFLGALTIDPPVLHATGAGSTSFKSTLQNVGNVALSAGTYRLDVRNAATAELALSRSVSAQAVAVSGLATLDFGAWTPPASGEYVATVTAAAAPELGTLTAKLYVGDAATGTFALDKQIVATGTQRVRATISVTGEDVAGSISDPLAEPIKAAIQKGVNFGDLNASNWAISNRCLGCHIVSQALVGGELTRKFTSAYRALDRNTLFNSMSTFRQNNGAVFATNPELSQSQTMLSLWALNAWHAKDEYPALLSSIADYVVGVQGSAGNWGPDDPRGWWISYTSNTSFNLKSLTEVIETLRRVPTPSKYLRQVVASGAMFDGAYSMLSNGPRQVLVANHWSGTVVNVNVDTGTVETVMTGLTYPYGLLRMPDGSFLVGTHPRILRRANDGTVSTFATVPGYNHGKMLRLPDGRILFSSPGHSTIYELPAGGGAASIYLAGAPLAGQQGLALDAAGNLIVANYDNQNILRVKPDKSVEVVVRWTNGYPRSITRRGNEWLVGTTTGAFRYNDEWQGETLDANRTEELDVLDDGTLVAVDGVSSVSVLSPVAIDVPAKIASYSAAVTNATNWLLIDGNTDDNNTMHQAHRLIGLGAAKGFYAGTPTAQTLLTKMQQIATTLRARQGADGGWGQTPAQLSDSMVTAMVGYALDYLNPPANDPVIRNAITFLLQRQLSDGSWASENGIFASHLAATTWVEIWLPIALDRVGGLDTRLNLRFPSNVAFSNPSVVPNASIAHADGSSTQVWALNSVTSAGNSLQFDLSLADMQANESRTVATEAMLSFNNSFTNEALSAPINIPVVRAPSTLDLAVRTDKASYGADFPVIVSAPVLNGGAGEATAAVRLSVLAPDGRVVSELGTFATGAIAAGGAQTVNAIWNTATTFAAPGYKVRAVLLGGAGQELSSAAATFAITGSTNTQLAARIVANQASYAPTDTVRLTDTLRNLDSNNILENATAHTSVRTATGGLIWQASQPIAQLVGASIKELLYSVPLAAAAAGQYSANVEVKDAVGVTLAAAATTFKVGNSAETATGLTGTLVVLPTEVSVGNAVALSWSLSNAGNAALSALGVEVRIIDPTTGLLLGSVTSSEYLAQGQTLGRVQSLTAANAWAGKSLVAALTVLNSSGARVTLAQDNFRVVAPNTAIKLEFGSVNHDSHARLLALVSCPPGDDTSLPDEPNCLNVRVAGLHAALTSLGVNHKIVTGAGDFELALRSGRYDTYWISGGAQKLTDTLVKEVRAAVQRGDALVLDGVHDSRNQILHDVAGVKQLGKLPAVNQTIEMLMNTVFAPGTVATSGRPTVFAVDSAQVHARFTSSVGHQQPAPALLTNQYGAGRATLFAFDLVQRLALVPDDGAQLDLVRKALAFSAPGVQPTLQYGVSAHSIEVVNSGPQAADVLVQATLPAGVRFIGASSEATGPQPDAQGNVTWRFTLPSGERRTVGLLVGVDVIGPVEISISVAGAAVGSTAFQAQSTYGLSVQSQSLDATALDAIAQIQALRPAARSETNAVNRALGAAQLARSLSLQGQWYQAISAWISAADELLRIESIDVQGARTAVARVIEGAERALLHQSGGL